MLVYSGCAVAESSGYVDVQYQLDSFDEVIADFTEDFIEAESKEDLPLFIPAEFAHAGVRRCTANVLAVHMLVFDIDRGTWDDLEPTLKLLEPYNLVLYSSFSHSEAQLKIRIIIELSRPVNVREWPSFWLRAVIKFKLNRLINGHWLVDNKCKDACHMYFVPGGDRSKFITEAQRDGAALDVDEVLALELPDGMAEPDKETYSIVLPDEERGTISDTLRMFWDASLENLCDEIRKRPYPGEIYDLKSHGVFGIARGAPHIVSASRIRNMVRSALDRRYRKGGGDPNVEGYREKAYEQVDQAIEDGMAVPWYPPKVNELVAFPLTEMGLAERLLHKHKTDIAWVEAFQNWLVWNGRFWNLESGRALVQERAKATIRAIKEDVRALYSDLAVAREHLEAVKDDPATKTETKIVAEKNVEAIENAISELSKFGEKSELASKIRAAIQIASSDPQVLASPADFNTKPWLLNCKNGTVDLRTGVFRNHSREDMLTRMVPHSYHPHATCPRFDQFLNEIFLGRKRLVDFVWRLLGYSFIGVTTEQLIVLCTGDGANGKSTLFNVIMHIAGQGAGGYGFAMQSDNLFTSRGGNQHPTWRMSLFGRRFVTAQESDEGRSFNESLIKELTGGDPITGRRMNENEWSYLPEHTIWTSSNHLPHIRGTDDGIWRRIRLLPFNASFLGREDPTLLETLKDEIPGILARIVQEAGAYAREGLHTPREVRAATERFKREQDPLEPFFELWCAKEASGWIKRDALWSAYSEYAKDTKSQVFHERKRFYAAIAKHYDPNKKHGVRGYNGLRLLSSKERQAKLPATVLRDAQKEANEAAAPEKRAN